MGRGENVGEKMVEGKARAPPSGYGRHVIAGTAIAALGYFELHRYFVAMTPLSAWLLDCDCDTFVLLHNEKALHVSRQIFLDTAGKAAQLGRQDDYRVYAFKASGKSLFHTHMDR
jgi:hypothetical protein